MAIIEIINQTEPNPRYVYQFDTDQAPLGRGGMGVVYRGVQYDRHNNGQQREVAIKCLYNNLSADVIERARSEASVRIKSDNLVEMIDFIETVEHTPTGNVHHYHVVSEYLDGVSLLDLLQGKKVSGNPYAQKLYSLYLNNREQFAITIVKNVLYGLNDLHNAGYVHRDVDPSNIMITADGKIKLLDFGISKNLREDMHMGASVTRAGTAMGKAAYSSPELVSGEVNKHLPQSDIYSVGIVLYVIMTGTLPFNGTYTQISAQVLTQPTPVKNVDNKRIGRIISKATAKDSAKRYKSATEFVAALNKIENNKPFELSDKLITGIVTGAAIVAGVIIGLLI